MFMTQKEIMDQHVALRKTADWFEEKKGIINDFFAVHQVSKFIVIGSGSSMMIAKSAAMLFWNYKNTSSIAISGGDFMLMPEQYRNACDDAALLFLSRSGQTTEVIASVQYAKTHFNSVLIGITTQDDSKLSDLCDLNITLPWANDEAVCQTSTISNMYTSIMFLAAIKFSDINLWQNVNKAISQNEKFKAENYWLFEKIAAHKFNNVIVLADGTPGGISEEGALAFSEIALIHAKHFNLLDFRHGPIILCDKNTLVFSLIRDEKQDLQERLVLDILKTGCTLVTFSTWLKKLKDLDNHYAIEISDINNYCAYGLPFLNGLQMTALARAIHDNHNPDLPPGLQPCILLN